MRRLVMLGSGALGALALSCQMLSGPSATPQVALVGATLPHVAAAPPVVLPAEEAVATDDVERIVQHLSERHTGLSRREIRSVARTIVEECESHGVDLHIVLGVIHVESAGYHRAVSPVGAIGLMQIMPATGEQLAREHGVEWYGPATLFDPIVNVRLGIAYLHELSDRYDHMPTALAAYNWGPGSIDRRIRRGARMPKIYVEQVRRAVDKVEQAEIGRASS